MKRVATAAVLAPLLWALVYFGPMWAFAVVVLVVMAGAMLEGYRLLASRGSRPLPWIGIAFALALNAAFNVDQVESFPVSFVFAAGIVLVVALSMWMRQEPAQMLDTALATIYPVLLVGFMLAHLIGLRLLGETLGIDLVFLLCLCVMLGDTAAYYVGSAIGRHKLAPVVSPKKTWEGVAGGLAGSIAAGWIAKVWFFPELPLKHALILGGVLGAAGVLGDLTVSMLKRAANAKDSSNLLPGHGGLLDRIDSLLVAAPLLYYYYRTFVGDWAF